MSNDFTPPGPPPLEPPDRPAPYAPYAAPAGPTAATSGYGRFERAATTLPVTDRRMSTWALVLSLVGCLGITWLVAVGLAIAALASGRDGVERGRWRAVAALVVCGAWAVTFVVLVAVEVVHGVDDTDTRSDPATSPGSTSVAALQVGDCLRSAQVDGLQSAIDVVACSEPHRGEVYAEFDVAGGTYPGRKEVIRTANQGCYDRVPDLDRRTLRGLSLYYLFPAREGFARDRSVTCIFETPQARTGTVGD